VKAGVRAVTDIPATAATLGRSAVFPRAAAPGALQTGCGCGSAKAVGHRRHRDPGRLKSRCHQALPDPDEGCSTSKTAA
jgi:hypothetical protein